MNKKGMTLVEIIVAISLISVVMIFLFQVLITVINGNKRNNTKSKTLISKAIVMKAVEHDLDTFGLSDNSGVVDCSNKIENYLTLDSGSINQIIPASARSEEYYCIKLTYNESSVKYNEGYLLFYQNNNKGFLAYKRGNDNVLETQIVREIDAIPKTSDFSELIKIAEDTDLYSLRINIPIIATDGNNYDLALNYINSGNLDYPITAPDEPITPTEKVIITIDANGGNYLGDNPIITTKGKAVQLSTATKEGDTFNGWEITSGDGTVSGNTIIANSIAITVQAQYKANIPVPVSFASDSWTTIAANVQANKEATASVYSVGSEKEVEIGGTNYTVRIANNSNYDCTLDSKTACGFVVEFVDIVEKRAMNSSDTNEGGWPATEMRTYLNREFLAKLPSDLQSVIAYTTTTTVISGHGSADKNTLRDDHNWESTDKLYLLSPGEIYSNCLTENCYDTASYPYNGSGATTTRQLDYYNGVTTGANYERAIKQIGGTSTWWWLRAADSYYSNTFRIVTIDGRVNSHYAPNSGGVAPAFRIA